MDQDKLLKKRLGVWSLTAAALGGVIGSGWLFGAMFAAQDAGPESIIGWVVGAIIFGLVALVFSELAIVKPESGSLVRYPMYTNGSLVASMIGWGMWLAYSSNPPTEASGIVQYLSKFFPGVYNGSQLTIGGIFLAILIMAVFVVINYYGVSLFAKTNLVVTAIKFVVPTLTLVGLLLSGFHPQNFVAHGGFAPYGWSAGLSIIATAGIVFAYTGFNAAMDLSGEAINPQRDVPRAVLLTIIIAVVLYVLLEIAFIGAVPVKDLSQGWHGVNFKSPFAELALSLNIMWLYWMIIADAMVSPAGSALVYTAGNARNVFGLAKNKFFPSYFNSVNEKQGIPTRALILNFIIGLLFLVPLKSWHSIIGVSGVLGVFVFSSAAVSVLVFIRAGVTRLEQRIKGINVIAPLSFIGGSLIIYWAKWDRLEGAITLILVGVVLYFITFILNKETIKEIYGGAWIVVYLIALMVMSKLGSFGGIKLIKAPWDSVVVALVSLVFYYWATSAGEKYMLSKEGKASDVRNSVSSIG